MGFFADKIKPSDIKSFFLQNAKDVVDFYRYDAIPIYQEIKRYNQPVLDISYDPCNFSVDYKFPLSEGNNNFVFGEGLPRLKIDIRNPYCTKTKLEEPKELVLQKKIPDPPENYCGNLQLIVAVAGDYFNYADSINGRWFLIRNSIRVTKIIYPDSQGQAYIEGEITSQHTYSKEYAVYQRYSYPSPTANPTTTKVRGKTINYSSIIYSIDDGSPLPFNTYFGIDIFNSAYPTFYKNGGLNSTYQIETTTGFYAYTLPNPDSPPSITVSTPIRTLSAEPEIRYDAFLGKFYRYSYPGIGIERENYRFYSTCGNWEPDPEPPPPPKKKDKDMNCCAELEALLKLVLKRIGNLPANVPDNFTKQNPSMINIESLAELMLWQMQQLDALSGAYPIEIEIEDADLVQEGNQKQKVSLPNQAEALAELIGMMLTIKRDTHANLITSIKAMGEAGMGKNLSVKILDVALANAEFLGYKLDQVEKEVPSLFTPGGKNITETLKETNVKIITYDNTDKNDLQDDLKVLKTMAARWNAQNWRAVRGDVVESLKQTLFGNPEAISDTQREKKQPDFNDFTEEAERGFITTSGITDSVNPWGRPYEQRPKIREIGTDKGRYDDDGTLLDKK